MAPSPMIAMTLRFVSAFKALATDIPRPAEMEVEEWPAPNGSYTLSERFVKPDNPPS